MKSLIDYYETLIDNLNIGYDSNNDTFYDLTKPIDRYLLNLTPEKYFRKESVQTIAFENFKMENKAIISELKSALRKLLGEDNLDDFE